MPNFIINVKEKGAKKAAGNIKSLTSSMKTMALQAVTVTAVVQGLKKSIQMSAEMEGVKRGFDNLAKSQGFSTAAFNKFRAATDGTIDSLTLMKQANNAMLLGITDSEDQMADMFDVAQRLGAALGVDTVQAVESLVTGLGRQCLTSDSFISTKDGMKQIIDIKEGDIILSYKEGKIIETEVTHLHNNGIQPTYIVTFKDGKYIKSTDNHRYLTDNGWKYLSELESGSKILNIDNEYSEIHSINSLGEEEVYDLTVPETANFFANGLCVHNSKLMLDNLGIMVDTNKSYKDYADSIGKTTSQLTDQERKTAFVNAAMKEANSLVAQLGEEQLTTKDSIAQVGTALGDLAITLGDRLAPSVNTIAQAFTDLLIDMNEVAFAQGALNSATIGAVNNQELLAFTYKEVSAELRHLENTTAGQILSGKKAGATTEAQREKYAGLKHELELLGSRMTELNILTIDSVEGFGVLSGSTDNINTSLNITNTETTDYLANLKKVEGQQMTSISSWDIMTLGIRRNTLERARNVKENLKGYALSNQGARDSMISVVQAESMEAISGFIASIFKTVPFPFNAILAAGAGGMVSSLISKNLQAIPQFATGADFVTSGPQMMMVGEGSGPEHVQVTPLSDPNINGPQGGGGSVTVNVSGNVMTEDFVSGELAENIKEAIRRGTDFGIS